MNSVISFILVLGVLIFVHELGHFLFAKLFGVRVLTFSIGFGNRLLTRRWGDTDYVISAFPLGGYVKMFGEQPDDSPLSPAEEAVSFSHKSVGQRFGIVFGGPFFNLLFAVLLFWAMFFLAGLPEPLETTVIGQVAPGSAAAKAGIAVGDEIVSIDGQATATWEEVSELIKNSEGREIELELRRAGELVRLRATPAMDAVKNIFGEEESRRYLLGIIKEHKVVYQSASILDSMSAALEQTWQFIYLTIMGIVKIFQRIVPASELGGPIRIAEIAGDAMEAGWLNLVYFTGLLSVNLGILNLLPIPVLDGGHLVFLSIEAARRRPLPLKAMEISQKVGIALLGTLMIFVFYNDIARIAQRWMAGP